MIFVKHNKNNTRLWNKLIFKFSRCRYCRYSIMVRRRLCIETAHRRDNPLVPSISNGAHGPELHRCHSRLSLRTHTGNPPIVQCAYIQQLPAHACCLAWSPVTRRHTASMARRCHTVARYAVHSTELRGTRQYVAIRGVNRVLHQVTIFI